MLHTSPSARFISQAWGRPIIAPALLVLAATCTLGCRSARNPPEPLAQPEPVAKPAKSAAPTKLELPAPQLRGRVSVEEALALRRSHRRFAPEPLGLAELGQLAWAAQGITDRTNGYRTSPSAGALYPLSVYLLTEAGVFAYLPASHALEQRADRDLREPLAQAALSQTAVRTAPCNVVITSVIQEMQRKYGDHAARYVAMEAGHVGQNLLLQATARGLVGVPIGAFDEEAVRQLLELPTEEQPLYIIALGRPPQDASR